ncbi:hypothetical protein [Intrasporangium oryzae]|uniref:hypothetical protein n=1 Tax=Intrasporangium oryzae TaxID=412687 RepID=UPI0012FAC5ED|nr:hypothetical protein [Intrasporangium oryzae]
MPWVLAACAALLVGWIAVLGATLGTSATVRHWDVSWIGLDILEVVGLLATTVLMRLRAAAVAQVAPMTAMVFLVDAWFDVTLSQPGWAYAGALLSAAVIEIPLAALCLLIGWRSSKGPTGTTADRPTAGPRGESRRAAASSPAHPGARAAG